LGEQSFLWTTSDGGEFQTGDAHQDMGSMKSSMGSITQIYSLTQREHKNTSKTLAIEASLSTTHVYQYCQGENGGCSS
jgi:hypothetical protein